MVRERSPHTAAWWTEWSDRSSYGGDWADEVHRSLILLKALIFAPTGGIVAAATTSLPEFLGGVRNWDYRFCWLRDAALTLDALMSAGYVEEATAWRDWVFRAVAGDPDDIQIMYGLGGERRLDRVRAAASPRLRRLGTGPHRQRRVGTASARRVRRARGRHLPRATAGDESDARGPALALQIYEWLEEHWHEPDDGVWEVRGGRGTSSTPR